MKNKNKLDNHDFENWLRLQLPPEIEPLTSDADFLYNLQQKIRLSQDSPAGYPKAPGSFLWLNGIFQGVAAAAVFLILFTGIHLNTANILQISVNSAKYLQETVLLLSVEQQLLWQELITNVLAHVS